MADWRRQFFISWFSFVYFLIFCVNLAQPGRPIDPELTENMQMAGGMGAPREMDDDVSKIAFQVRDEAEKMATEKGDQPFEVYEPVQYTSQVVAGANYFIKVKVACDRYIHLRVFEPLPYTNAPPELSAMEIGKTQNDPIDYINMER